MMAATRRVILEDVRGRRRRRRHDDPLAAARAVFGDLFSREYFLYLKDTNFPHTQKLETTMRAHRHHLLLLFQLSFLFFFFNPRPLEAKLYGSYSRTSGSKRPSGVRFSSRLAYNAYGRRKLLQEEEEDSDSDRSLREARQNLIEPIESSCAKNNDTMYNVLQSTPELSRFFNVSLRYPKVVNALKQYSRYDTVFAPSDEAIQDLVE